MKRILVTGGAGFLGSHLVDRLLLRHDDLSVSDAEVVVVDNFSPGAEENLSRHPRLTVFYGNVADPHDLAAAGKVDEIYHLACPASPVHYQADQVTTMETAVMGTRRVLEYARRCRARVFIASTSEVYGDPLVHPQREDYWGNANPYGPRACYSDDTEVLTKRGWVLFQALRKGVDEVATIDPEQRVEFVRPTEIIRQHYRGDLLHFSNLKMDLLVTPNHKMIDERSGRQFVQADAPVEWKHRHAPVSGTWPEWEVPARWPLPPAPPNAKVTFEDVALDDWLEFVGIYLAEGCVYVQTQEQEVNGKMYPKISYRVLLAHDHGWKEERMRALLARLQLSNKQLALALEPFGRKSLYKCVPREYMDLPPAKLRILFEGMMFDGQHPEQRAYFTSSRALADAMQEIAIKIGLGATIAHVSAAQNPYSDIDGFRVNLRPPVQAHYTAPVRVPYDGEVWCVDAPPHHTLLVRRGGKAIFCGNCYDEGKRAAEALSWCFHKQHGVDVRIARIFNTYGPRMRFDDGRVVSNFVLQALRNEPITIYGNGQQTRSFCYVSDLVRGFTALMALAASDTQDPRHRVNYPVNLGNPGEFTMVELAQLVVKGVRGPMPVFENPLPAFDYRPLPPDDPTRRRPDIGRATGLLRWTPQVQLAEGLAATISDFRARLDAPARATA